MANVLSYKNIDPHYSTKNYLGFKYYNPNKNTAVHEMRCVICGKWHNYEITRDKVIQYMKEGNWDLRKGEKAHCGNSRCNDYHRITLQSWTKQEELKTLKYTAVEGSRAFNLEYEKIMEKASRRL